MVFITYQMELKSTSEQHRVINFSVFHHLIVIKRKFWGDKLPKLTVMLKYLVVSAMCLDSASDPVRKLRTEPAPLACMQIREKIFKEVIVVREILMRDNVL